MNLDRSSNRLVLGVCVRVSLTVFLLPLHPLSPSLRMALPAETAWGEAAGI